MFTKNIFPSTLLFILLSCNFLSAQTNLYIRLNTSNGQTAAVGDNYLNTHFPNHPDFISAREDIVTG